MISTVGRPLFYHHHHHYHYHHHQHQQQHHYHESVQVLQFFFIRLFWLGNGRHFIFISGTWKRTHLPPLEIRLRSRLLLSHFNTQTSECNANNTITCSNNELFSNYYLVIIINIFKFILIDAILLYLEFLIAFALMFAKCFSFIVMLRFLSIATTSRKPFCLLLM